MPYARLITTKLALVAATFLFSAFSYATPTPYVASDHYQVSAGVESGHTCAIDDTGVHCWGDNTYGQTDVPNLTNPTMVSAGAFHTCALDNTGVHCWGFNGDGETTVPSLTNPTMVSAGVFHTCALDDTGVHCWGDNTYGQTDVPNLTNPTMVSAGLLHTCAIDDTGVHCWGNNSYGQTTVPSLTNPTMVSAGGFHTCALDNTGVHCWGFNGDGETTVPSLTNPTMVSAGVFHTCALDDTGVHCWGDNSDGEATVPSLTNPTMVSAGAFYTCALDDTGVHCWGFNGDGETTVPCLMFNSVSTCPPTSTPTQTPTPTPSATPVHSPAQTVNGGSPKELFGSTVAYIGDINADGYGDYIAGAPYYDIPAAHVLKDAGKATVISGKTQQALYTFYGSGAKAYFGSAVAGVGDVDGDGTPDFAVGAYNDNVVVNKATLTGAGSITVYSGLDGHVLYKKQGDQSREYFGYSITGLHDVDGDDKADIAVGAYLADKSNANFTATRDLGRVDIFVGPTGDLYRTYWGEKSGDGFGFAVAYAGDIDHDDYGDLIVGAPFSDSFNIKNSGRVSIFSPYVDKRLIAINGASINSNFGFSVSAAGDVDDDGTDDVIVGAPKYDAPVYDTNLIQVGVLKDAGSASIYSGATWRLLYQLNGRTEKEYMGTSVTSVGSVDGDSYADVAIGSPGYDLPPFTYYSSKAIKDAGKIAVYSGATQAMLFVSFGAYTTGNFGWSMSSGNVDQDFIKDIVVGAPRSDIPLKDTGNVSVVSGSVP